VEHLGAMGMIVGGIQTIVKRELLPCLGQLFQTKEQVRSGATTPAYIVESHMHPAMLSVLTRLTVHNLPTLLRLLPEPPQIINL